MDARMIRAVFGTVLLVLVSMGARYRSANFIIETDDPRFAQLCGETAEKNRRDLAIEWLGQPMPNWSQPCPVTIRVGPNLGAGGATSFVFDRGEVFGWRMSIQGPPQRLLDSVIPHEVTHMIFASHFRQPLPRWADEGGATSIEHVSERNKHRQMLDQFLRTGRGIPFSRLFAMTEYPADVMPLYAQGYSLAEYLIQIGGRRKYIEFLDDGMKNGDWSSAVQRNYSVQDLGQLQNSWLAWVKQGSPINRQPGSPPDANSAIMLVSNPPQDSRGAATGLIGNVGSRIGQAIRGTSPRDSEVTLAGPLAPVPNPMLRNVPPTNPNVFANAGARGTSVYAPRSLPANSQVAVMPAVMSADGWRPRGSNVLATASASNASAHNSTQVTKPQPSEGPKQRILEWNRR